MLVETFLSELPVERFNERTIGGLSRTGEVEFEAVEVSPPVERVRDKFRSVVDADALRRTKRRDNRLQSHGDVVPIQPLASSDCEALTTKVFDCHKQAKAATIEQLIGDEVHVPALVGPDRPGRLTAYLAALMTAWRFYPHLPAFFDVEPIDQLVIHLPAFPLEQDVYSPITIPDACSSQVPQADPKFGPVVADTMVTLRGARLTQQSAGPPFADAIARSSFVTMVLRAGLRAFPKRHPAASSYRGSSRPPACLSFRFSSSSCFRRRSSATPTGAMGGREEIMSSASRAMPSSPSSLAEKLQEKSVSSG